jgi:hypothetical protein
MSKVCRVPFEPELAGPTRLPEPWPAEEREAACCALRGLVRIAVVAGMERGSLGASERELMEALPAA